MQHAEDRELTKRVNARSEQAFLEVYDRFSAALYRHVLLRIGSREAAEDTVSHTFMKVWEYLRDPEHRIENCKAFLFRTAHNHIVDHWRASGRELLTIDDEENGSMPEPSTPATAPDAVDDALDVRFLRERLSELPPEARDLLLWRYVDELPITDIARIIKKTAGATYVAIHRARRQLEKNVLEFRLHQRPPTPL